MSRRTFTLQLHDRPESLVVNPPTRRNADHVYDTLNGNPLECPSCGQEPIVRVTNVNAMPVHSLRGVVGVAKGTTTMEARCDACRMDIGYTLDRDGAPHMTDQVWWTA